MRALAALVIVLAACAPPPDVPRDGDRSPKTGVTTPDAQSNGGSDPAVPPHGATGSVNETPQQPRPSDGARDGLYTKLAGGVYVLRCPACLETQPSGSVRCGGCRQELRPRGKQSQCGLCGGDGRCHHCGDDRDCLACGATGQCAYCDGGGHVGEEKCEECRGGAGCRECGADGRRESVKNEFDALETALPGICPTCVDGSGLCPECGASGIDTNEETCLSCGGKRLCWDCLGLGTCPYDGADGLCVGCGGSGVEVVDLPRLPPHHRRWRMRTSAGTILEGRQTGRPDPNLHLDTDPPIAKTREEVHPLTYFQAYRDYTDAGDAKAWRRLAAYAEEDRYWPLAVWALRRAMEADPAVSHEVTTALRLVEGRRAQSWVDAAEKALAAEDRERAKRLFTLVRGAAPGTDWATRARTSLFSIDAQEDIERKQLDEETRARIAREAQARVERVLRAVDARLALAKRLLHRARSENSPDAAITRLFDRAEWVARDAQRLLLRTAYRLSPTRVPWPRPPGDLLVTIRKQRASVLQQRSVREVAGGRFDVGLRLADRADRLDPGNALIGQARRQAELGVLRRGVHLGSPPAEKEPR